MCQHQVTKTATVTLLMMTHNTGHSNIGSRSIKIIVVESTAATTLNVGQQDAPEATVTTREEITTGAAVRATIVAAELRIPKARLPKLCCLLTLADLL